MTSELISNQTLEKFTWEWRNHSITYTVAGSGQPLLMIHGFGASIGHWRKNIPVLADQGYRVWAIDLLGFGQSDKPNIEYNLELWQQQIYDFCCLKIQQPTVFIGNSIGGLLTLMLMSEYPNITKGGIIINCAGGLNHRPEELRFPLSMIMGTFTKLVTSPVTGQFVFERIRQKKRIRNTLYQVYRDRAAVTDELVDILYQPSCAEGAQKVFASVLKAPAGPKPTNLLPKINQPLLVLWGEEDPWTPIKGAKIYQQRAETDSNTEFYTIPKAGHCPHDEKPEIVNQQITSWLEKLN